MAYEIFYQPTTEELATEPGKRQPTVILLEPGQYWPFFVREEQGFRIFSLHCLVQGKQEECHLIESFFPDDETEITTTDNGTERPMITQKAIYDRLHLTLVKTTADSGKKLNRTVDGRTSELLVRHVESPPPPPKYLASMFGNTVEFESLARN